MFPVCDSVPTLSDGSTDPLQTGRGTRVTSPSNSRALQQILTGLPHPHIMPRALPKREFS